MTIELVTKERVNLNALNNQQKKALTQQTYKKTSYFEEVFSTDQVEFNCESITHALRNEIERLLIEKNVIDTPVRLEELHKHLSAEMKEYNFNDGVNKLSTFFYETDAKFMDVYYQLISYIRENIVKEPFWFQATPTIRLHCPDGKNSDHYPRYHTDIGYGHPPEEINLWMPLTETLSGHSFRIMSLATSKQIMENFDYDFERFIHSAINDKHFTKYCEDQSAPVETAFGRILAFDPRCIHTGEPMKAHTRASIDIRVVALSQYEKMEIEYQGSGRRKILFAPGHCYDQRHSDYFLDKKGR